MCGRFTFALSIEDIKRYISQRFDIFDIDQSLLAPRYNIAPSQQVVTLIHDGNKYRLGTLKWGLVPPFAKNQKIGYSLINAKAETIASKPSFKPSFENRRCLILASGFYEWDPTGEGKLPHYFYVKDKPIITFAGIWSSYKLKNEEKLYTCAIITTTANDLMKDVHPRMPVILDGYSQQKWLVSDKSSDKELLDLLVPYDSKAMGEYRVEKTVNNPFIDNSDLIKAI